MSVTASKIRVICLSMQTLIDIAREADGTFDWFKSYNDVAHIFREAVPDKSSRILMLGCGNSKLSEEVRIHSPVIILR